MKDESTNGQPLSGPKDRSLEAYKEWFRRIIKRLIKEGNQINWTEEEWIANWKEYWKTNPNLRCDHTDSASLGEPPLCRVGEACMLRTIWRGGSVTLCNASSNVCMYDGSGSAKCRCSGRILEENEFVAQPPDCSWGLCE